MEKNMRRLPRGYVNRNPGNIRNNSDLFQGEVRPSRDRAFKQFKTMAYGYRAMFKILSNYHRIYSLKTIKQMIGRWAPRNENNTDAYVHLVSTYAGIEPDAVVDINSQQQMCAIVAGMSKVENGVAADLNDVKAGWDLL